MKKLFFTIWALAIMALFSGCMKKIDYKPIPEVTNPVASARGESGAPLLAGFAKQSITPRGPVWMAGFGEMRMSYGVHDDLFARTLVLRQGDVKLAMVSLDLLGLQNDDVEKIKARVPGFTPDQILIASTHTHSGPDTIGFWGKPPFFSGVSPRVMKNISDGIVTSIVRAEAELRPADVSSAAYEMDPTIMFNANEGEPEDNTMGIVALDDKSGGRIATLINVNGHPEAMWSDNHYISSDYAGRVCVLAEESFGGGAIFFSGALGAMITPNLAQSTEGRGFDTLEKVSQKVFVEIERGMGMLVSDSAPTLAYRRSRLLVHTENEQFILAVKIGLLKREVYEGDRFSTGVSVIEIGSAQFVTFPGEAYPKQGLNIRKRQKPHSFQIGLADDELGYILYPPDYGTELYKYETSMCVGPELAPMMEEELIRLLEMSP